MSDTATIAIRVLEPTGIKCKLGHLLHGETRIVPRDTGLRFIQLGWAEHVPSEGEQLVPTGEREERKRRDLTPVSAAHR